MWIESKKNWIYLCTSIIILFLYWSVVAELTEEQIFFIGMAACCFAISEVAWFILKLNFNKVCNKIFFWLFMAFVVATIFFGVMSVRSCTSVTVFFKKKEKLFNFCSEYATVIGFSLGMFTSGISGIPTGNFTKEYKNLEIAYNIINEDYYVKELMEKHQCTECEALELKHQLEKLIIEKKHKIEKDSIRIKLQLAWKEYKENRS